MKPFFHRSFLSVFLTVFSILNITAQPMRPTVRAFSFPSGNYSTSRNGSTGNSSTALSYTQTVIGTTLFDLQSNEGPPRRVVNNGDGTISAAWTYSNESSQSSFTDRGTGYNYYNGTAWNSNPTSRIENIRTGFTNIGVVGGKEYVMTHGSSGGILASRTKGTGSWTIISGVGGASPGQDTWFRMAVGGSNNNTIHAIVNSQGSLTSPVLGQSGPITYSRSTNGGSTWDIQHVQLTGSTSAFYTGFGAENYSIDCSGDTVVVVAGLPLHDVVMWKSVNNGTSWTKTIIQAAPIAAYNLSANYTSLKTDINGDGVGDTVTTCSGDVNVTLDINGQANVTWSNLKVCDNDISTSGYYTADDSYGISYWKEGSGSVSVLNGIVDQNSDGRFTMITNPAYDPYGLMYKNKALTCHPQIGFDTQNDIFIVYAAVCETSDTATYIAQYRHVYIAYSTDGGASWSLPEDLTSNNSREGLWPSIAKRNTSYLSVVYQRDNVPDIYLGNGAGGSFLCTYNAGVVNDIVFVNIQNPALNSVVTLSGPSVVCRNGTATYTVNNATGATGYAWTVPSGATIVSGQNTSTVTVQFGSTSGSVQCLTTFPGGTTVGKTLSVSVETVNISASVTGGNYCSGGSATLLASGASTYAWNPSTGLSSTTGSSVSASPTTTTTYTVTGTSANGCTSSSTVTVTVRSNPSVSATPSSTNLCSGTSTNVTASGASTYAWSPSTGLSATTGSSVTATPSSTTTYTVTGTGSNGCTATTTFSLTVLSLPTVSASAGSSTICSGTSTSLTASGASSYAWSPSTGLSTTTGSSVTANPTSSTVYTVTGTTANGCTSSNTVSLSVLTSPSVSALASSPSICSGTSTTLTANGAVSYSWSPSTGLSATTGSSVTANPTSTTTYTVTGTGSNGCTSTTTVTLTILNNPTVTTTPSSSNLCSGSSLSLSANGASSYSWSPSTGLSGTTGSSVTANPTISITYTVTGTAANGCTATSTVAITLLSRPNVIASAGSSNFCSGISTTLTASGAITYAWNPSTGLSGTTGSSVMATPSTSTVYTVIGTAGNGCTSSATVSLTVRTSPTVIATAGNSSICSGTNTLLSATGASTYVWSPSAGLSSTTGSSVTATPAGSTTYTVTGTAANGCTGSGTVFVTILTRPTVTASGPTSAICLGANANLTASGASSYVWNPSTGLSGTTGSSVTATPNSTTTYTVTGTAANGCTSSATVTVSVTVVNLNPTATLPSICSGDTTTLTASGASTYVWSPATDLSSTTGASVDASPASITEYTVTGTTSNGCTSSSTITITVATDLNVTVSATSNNVCEGNSVTITANGGNTYSWSPSTFLNTTTGISVVSTPTASIEYTVTGTSINGCTGSATITLNEFSNPVVNASAASASFCNGDSTTLSATGANTYQWNPSSGLDAVTGSTVTAYPVTSTIYTVTGTGNGGCTATSTVSISVLSLPTLNATAGPSAICSGTTSTLAATGAVSYSWSPSGGLSSTTGSSVSATPGSTSTYTVTGTAANGCTSSTTVQLTVNPKPNVGLSAGSTSFCRGDSTNMIASGANTYSWSPSSGLSATTGIAVTAVPTSSIVYTVIGTSIDGCKDTAAISLTVLNLPNVTVAPSTYAICPGSSSTLTSSGAVSYAWSPVTGLNTTTGSSVMASPSATTIYTVTGTAANGCTATDTTLITALISPTVNASAATGSICAGSSTTLNASGASTYSWSPSTGLSATTGSSVTATPASTTTYTVIGTGSNGCTSSSSVTVTVIANPVVQVTPSSASYCSGGNTSLSASGANSYTWSPSTGLSGTTGATVTASPTTTTVYIVTGTGTGNCTAASTVTVTVLSNPVVTASASPGNICSGSSSTLTATGASTYAWSPSTGLSATTGSSVTASPVSATTYTVTGTAANGCSSIGAVTLGVLSNPSVSASAVSPSICNGSSTVLNASGATTYTWSPSTGLSSTIGSSVTASPTVSTVYTVVGSFATGCTRSATVAVSVNSNPVVIASATASTICLGSGTQLSATGSSTYSWSPSTGLSSTTGSSVTASPTSTITYTVTGTSGNGCTSSSTVTVTVAGPPPITVSGQTAVCPGSSTSLTASGAAGYVWSPSAGLNTTTGATVTASPSSAITYTVTGTSAAGCVSSTTVSLTISAPAISVSAPSYCIAGGDSVSLSASGSVTYSWSPSSGLSSATGTMVKASPSVTTTYTVTGTSGSNCTTSATITVYVNSFPSATITNPNPFGFCPGSSALLNSTTNNGTSYQWLLNNNIIPGATNSNYQTNTPGSYAVIITNSLSCSTTSSTVTVAQLTPPAISASVSPSTTVCSGELVTVNGSGGVSYSWNGGITNGNPFVINDTTTFTVTGAGSNGCTATSSVTINAVPYPVQTSIIGDTSIVPNVQYYYYVAPQSGVTYYWIITGGIIQGGQGTDSLQVIWNPTGVHLLQVEITNSASCQVISSLTAQNNNCNLIFSILQAGNPLTCDGDTIYLVAQSSSSSIFHWFKDGNVLTGENSDSLMITTSGDYQLEITIGPCDTVSAPVTLTFLPRSTSPVITSASQNGSCGIQSDTLTVSGSFASYLWSNGSVNTSIVIDETGIYTVIASAANGCTSTSTFVRTDPFLVPSTICLVSVDTVSGKNIVVWEKPSVYGIDSFYVYKETSPGNYSRIAAVNENVFSVYEDLSSNPAASSDRYRISALDTCGNETELSVHHKTIHLSVVPGIGQVDLSWDNYEGYSFAYVYILRGFSPSALSIIDSVAYPFTNYSDLNPTNGILYYAVEIHLRADCQPVARSSSAYSFSRSNVENVLYDAINTTTLTFCGFTLYPNPSSGSVNIRLNQMKNNRVIIRVTDLSGRLIVQLLDAQLSAGRYELKWDTKDSEKDPVTGVYFISILTDERTETQRVVILE